jgi:hypothetical protein
VGQLYFVFNMIDHIRVLASHFDRLVKEAVIRPTDMPAFLREQLREIR